MRFEVHGDRPMDVDWAAVQPRAISVTAMGERVDFEFLALDGLHVVRVRDVADYYVWDDRIVCHLRNQRNAALVPVHLFGMVLSLWLEQRGVLTLHAAAVTTPAGAVAVVAAKGGGKTSLAAALVRTGCGFLTDDLLALSVSGSDMLAQPAYPQLRMAREQARALCDGSDAFPVVNPTTGKVGVPIGRLGAFADGPVPLVAAYLLERVPDAAGVRIEPLKPRAAFLDAVRHTFLPREVADLGLQRHRFPALVHLASSVAFRRVRVPHGLDTLPDHAGRIVDDAQLL